MPLPRWDWVRGHVEQGELVTVLEEYCPSFPGLYLYYPQRRHAPLALRAFIEYLRRPTTAPSHGRAKPRPQSR